MCDLLADAVSARRIELSNLARRASRLCGIKDGLCHAGLDEPRTEGVDADARARELPRARLAEIDDGGFGGRVV